MRLTESAITVIRKTIRQQAGEQAHIKLFGSRLDDSKRGGDIDLLVTLPTDIENPAMLAARISAELHRQLNGRKVDILLQAPNLQELPIHKVAEAQGIEL